MLKAQYTPRFEKDIRKIIRKQNSDFSELSDLINLILQDTKDSREELVRRHRKHALKGKYKHLFECHVANAGDWLLLWKEENGFAIFLRTGTHDELFK